MVYKIPYAGAEAVKPVKMIEVKRALEIPPCPDSIKKILLEVCKQFEVHPNDVVGRGQTAKLVTARDEFIWRCKCETDASFSRIGKVLNRDHSTIVYHFQYRKARNSSVLPTVKWRRNEITKNLRVDRLNERQEEVRLLIVRGYNKYEIAAALGISVTVVKNDMRAIKYIRPLPEGFG